MSGDKSDPDKLHEREVERSNVTLNTFFGSSRQKPWMLRGGTPVRPTPRSSQAVTALSQGSSSSSISSLVFNNRTRVASLGKKTSNLTNVVRSEELLQNKNKVNEDIPTAATNLIDPPNSRVINISQSLSDLNSDNSQSHSSKIVDPKTLEPVSESSTDLTTELERELPKEPEPDADADAELTTTLRKEPPEESNIELTIVPGTKVLKEVPSQLKAKLPTELKLEKETQLRVEPVTELRVEPVTELRVGPPAQLHIKPIEGLSIDLCENSSELDLSSEKISQDSPSKSLGSYELIQRSQPQIHAENREALDSLGQLNIDQARAVNAVPQSEISMSTQSLNNDHQTFSNSAPQEIKSPIISSKFNNQALKTHKDSSGNEITVTEASPMVSPSQSSRFTLKSKLTMIEAQLKSVGGLESLNTGLERPRFQLLIEACRVEDFFYVILHQIYILWDFRREEVLSIPEASNIGSLQIGFRIVAKIIHENNQLAPNHKRWFAEFPHSLTKLLETSDNCRKTYINVLNCVIKLSTNWYPLMHECKTRLAPLLAEELVNKLGVLSPIF
ncbi:hypothetical protein EPUL_001610, partial [Erysiphe pulchra]